jgi:hypothetical protein
MRREDLRDASVLARAELRAMTRRLMGDTRQKLAVGAMALQFGVVIPLLAFGTIAPFGARLAGGDPSVGVVGAAATAALGLGLFVGGFSTVTQNRIGSVGPLVRTSMAPSAVAAGRLGSELLQTAAMLVLPVVVVLVLVGVGAGGPLAPVALVLALVPPLVAGTLIGRSLGAGVRYAGLLTGLSTWTKVSLFLLGSGVAFVGTQVVMQGMFGDEESFAVASSVPPLLPGTPLQAYTSVFLAPLGAPARPVGLLVAAAVFGLVGLGLVAAVRLEARLLVTDAGDDAEPSDHVTRGIPAGFAPWRSTRTAWRHLLRSARDPKSMSHLFPLAMGGLAMAGPGLVNQGPVFGMLRWTSVIGGAVLAGAAYCLNPLGDDRDQLPLVLTSVDSTGVLLRGRALAGAFLGLVLAVGVGTPMALLTESPVFAAVQSLFAVVCCGASAGTALGLGAVVPKFERREYVNVERAHPSQVALIGFMFAGVAVVGGGLFLLQVALAGRLPVTVGGGLWAAFLAVLTICGVGGYCYAVRKFDDLVLDDV